MRKSVRLNKGLTRLSEEGVRGREEEVLEEKGEEGHEGNRDKERGNHRR